MVKTTAAKRLAEEKDIAVREAERQLDVNVYLTVCEWWVPFGLHHDFLLHRMPIHAVTMGQKEHDHAICHSRWEPSPVWDLGAEPSVVKLVYANSMREEIADVYQLWQLPGKMPCDAEMEEHLHKETLDAIKECLQHKWDPTLPEELRHPTSTPRHDPQANYSTQNHANLTSSKIQHEVPVRRPQLWWGMPTDRHWWFWHC